MAWTRLLISVPRMRGIGFASPTVLRNDRLKGLFYFVLEQSAILKA